MQYRYHPYNASNADDLNSESGTDITNSTDVDYTTLMRNLNIENKLLENQINKGLCNLLNEDEKLPEIENFNQTNFSYFNNPGIELNAGPPPLTRQHRYRSPSPPPLSIKEKFLNCADSLISSWCKSQNPNLKPPRFRNPLCRICQDPIPKDVNKNLCAYCFSFGHWQKNYSSKLNKKYINRSVKYYENINNVNHIRYKECRQQQWCFECGRYMHAGCLVGRLSLQFNFNNDNAVPSCGSCIRKYLRTI